jgi:hypothetical protein
MEHRATELRAGGPHWARAGRGRALRSSHHAAGIAHETASRAEGHTTPPSRRGLLVLALLVVGVSEARRHWPGDVRSGSAAAHGARILRYDIRSRFVLRTLPQVAALPRGAGSARRPLLVFLRGRGTDGQESNANSDFFAALDALGTRAPAVVFPSGGVSSHWHARGDGDWARYVLDEVIPQAIRRLHADTRRVATGGISMGGYGAFARLRPARFCAVGGHSPALWLQAGDSAAGASTTPRTMRATTSSRLPATVGARRGARRGYGSTAERRIRFAPVVTRWRRRSG